MRKLKVFRREEYDHKSFALKGGDKAIVIFDTTYGTPEEVVITGRCDEGHGYEARKTNGEEIHTCNGFLTTSKTVARKYQKRVLESTLANTELAQTAIRNKLKQIRSELKKLA